MFATVLATLSFLLIKVDRPIDSFVAKRSLRCSRISHLLKQDGFQPPIIWTQFTLCELSTELVHHLLNVRVLLNNSLSVCSWLCPRSSNTGCQDAGIVFLSTTLVHDDIHHLLPSPGLYFLVFCQPTIAPGIHSCLKADGLTLLPHVCILRKLCRRSEQIVGGLIAVQKKSDELERSN